MILFPCVNDILGAVLYLHIKYMLQIKSIEPLPSERAKALLLAKWTSMRFQPSKHLVKGSFLLFHDMFVTWIIPLYGKS